MRLCLEFPYFFLNLKPKPNHRKQKHMKKLLTLTGIASIGAVLALLAACETTGSSQAVVQKESLLSQSGFKTITVTTPTQQQAVSGLTQGRVSAVKYNGKLYYVYPTAQKDRIYVGREKQFTAYKQSLAAQSASHPSMAQQGQQQMAGQSLMPTLETAGPHNVEVQQFGGFGPMGVNALGDW
jgi:crotonobetainyl-CoA:carnitine CoA-transferase CaiB-like acyl-CoA transferase